MRDNKVNVLKKMLGMLLVAPLMLSLSLFAADPIHHWELDETAGSIYEDTGTIGDANGTCTSPDSCPTPSDGQVYGAQNFDGNDTIEVNGAGFDWNTSASATIEFWMKSSALPSSGDNDVMIGRTSGLLNTIEWYIGIDGAGAPSQIGNIRAYIIDGGSPITGTTNINNGKWNHIAYVLKPGQVRVYVNGENDFNISRMTTDLSFDTNVTIGSLDNAAGDWGYTGDLDDIKLYATDLNGSTIKAHYENGFKPHLVEVTPVPTPTDGSDLKYTFSSDKNGTITYSGLCDSLDIDAIDGDNTITFDPLPDGTYSDCNITVTSTDGNVSSDPLAVSSFVVETAAEPAPTAPATTSDGGGCTYNPDSKNFDMMFLLMIAVGLFYPMRRRFIK